MSDYINIVIMYNKKDHDQINNLNAWLLENYKQHLNEAFEARCLMVKMCFAYVRGLVLDAFLDVIKDQDWDEPEAFAIYIKDDQFQHYRELEACQVYRLKKRTVNELI